MTSNRWGLPHLGLGLGLRVPHYDKVLSDNPPVDFFEVTPENFMFTPGRPRYVLKKVAERYPITFHAITINIGSTDPLDLDYLAGLKSLCDDIGIVYLSDHLCWVGIAGYNLHEILPMPLTDASLRHTTERVKRVQGILGRPLFLENSSGYMAYRESTMTENEFLVRLCEAADCGMLFDVNNLFQGAYNHGYDAQAYVDSIPIDRIGYHHVAGYKRYDKYLLDTHDHPVDAPVWDLYARCEKRTGGRTTLLEWDANLPTFDALCEELKKAEAYRAAVVTTP